MGAVSIHSPDRYCAWRMGCLILVAPWDTALRAFAERADLLPRRMAALRLDSDTVAHDEPAVIPRSSATLRGVRKPRAVRMAFEAGSRGSDVAGLLSERGKTPRACI